MCSHILRVVIVASDTIAWVSRTCIFEKQIVEKRDIFPETEEYNLSCFLNKAAYDDLVLRSPVLWDPSRLTHHQCGFMSAAYLLNIDTIFHCHSNSICLPICYENAAILKTLSIYNTRRKLHSVSDWYCLLHRALFHFASWYSVSNHHGYFLLHVDMFSFLITLSWKICAHYKMRYAIHLLV